MCGWVINCGGLFSDEICHKAGIRPDFNITPRKGSYLVFDPMKIKVSNWRRGFATGFATIIVVGNVSFPIAVIAGIVK